LNTLKGARFNGARRGRRGKGSGGKERGGNGERKRGMKKRKGALSSKMKAHIQFRITHWIGKNKSHSSSPEERLYCTSQILKKTL